MNKIKKGDEVIVIAGKSKGHKGAVLAVYKNGKLLVEGANIVKKHTKPNPQANEQGGVIDKTMPIDRSNVMLLDPHTKKGSRVGIRVQKNGQSERFYKSSNELVDVK